MNVLRGSNLTTRLTIAIVLCGALVPVAADQNRASAAAIEGRVLAGAREPLAGAIVFVAAARSNAPGQSVISDADGRFQFSGLAEGRYVLRVRMAGYVPDSFSRDSVNSMQIDVRPGQPPHEIQIRM